MFRIPGFMHPVDAVAHSAILLYQVAENLSGSVAEIGINFGRSFFLMAQALKPDEKCFACDLFENGPQINGESLQLREFRRSAQRFDITLEPSCLFVGSSQRLEPSDILKAVGPIRFFSIDGGHMIEDVREDFALASSVLTEHGVLALDDFCNPNWPEVSAAVFDCLRAAEGRYRPFAITGAKLYVCRDTFHDRYLTMLKSSNWMRGFTQYEISLMGSRLIFFHHQIGHRVMFEALARVGLGSVAFAIQRRL
jgi:hypothetical protein